MRPVSPPASGISFARLGGWDVLLGARALRGRCRRLSCVRVRAAAQCPTKGAAPGSPPSLVDRGSKVAGRAGRQQKRLEPVGSAVGRPRPQGGAAARQSARRPPCQRQVQRDWQAGRRGRRGWGWGRGCLGGARAAAARGTRRTAPRGGALQYSFVISNT
ncbi:MAG: hypothetical protein J3K34DRAFT_174432 [Monoraphidium minutum]|nr:MAG: hypothetical protein J3K34DRAFT_174432 [Monoraphidium minutum]